MPRAAVTSAAEQEKQIGLWGDISGCHNGVTEEIFDYLGFYAA
jgi:hypothetical protein